MTKLLSFVHFSIVGICYHVGRIDGGYMKRIIFSETVLTIHNIRNLVVSVPFGLPAIS